MTAFLLILTFYRGSAETVPYHFESRQECVQAGEQIDDDTDVTNFSCIEIKVKR